MPPTTRSEDVDESMLKAIRKCIDEALEPIKTDISQIRNSITTINTRITDIERGIEFTTKRVEDTIKNILPAMSDHMSKIAQGLAKQTLAMDVHRRKWNLVLHGLSGEPGEDADKTRDTCLRFAEQALQIPNAAQTHLSACHRLSRKKDAGIIIRFCDIRDRDKWMSATKHLKNHPGKISLSPDLPLLYAR